MTEEEANVWVSPKISELSVGCKNFSDAHRYVIQYLIRKGCITKKQFYLAYLKYHVTVTLQQELKSLSTCEGTETEIDELVKTLVKVCNQKCQQIGFRVKLITKESNEKQFVVICSDRPFSSAMLTSSGWKDDDHVCITNFIKYSLQNQGKIERTWAREFSRKLPNPMPAKQVEHLLDVLAKQKWFYWSECETFLEMDVRLIAELEPLLRFQYNIPHCIICNSPTIDLHFAAECPGCESKFHQRCFRKLIEASNGSTNCSECQKKLTSNVLSEENRLWLRYFKPNEEQNTVRSPARTQTESEDETPVVEEVSPTTSKKRRRSNRNADATSESIADLNNMTTDDFSQMNIDVTATAIGSITRRRSSRLSSSAVDKPDNSKTGRKDRSSGKGVATTAKKQKKEREDE